MAAPDPSIPCTRSLFEVPPSTMEKFCKLMDCSDGDLGWRGLAEHLSPDWMEFRKVEKYAEQGKSRTRELLWSWAQKNKTVGDLLVVLHLMGNDRAIDLFSSQGSGPLCVRGTDHMFTGVKENKSETYGVLPTLEFIPRGTTNPPQKEKRTLPAVCIKEIKDVTNDFHQDFLIGEGQFFDTYKADIQKQMCVVKLLKKEQHLADLKLCKLFLSKWKDLPRLNHPNILGLLGYFSSDEHTCMVYPYLPNGSLFNRIQCSGKSEPLPWKIRYDILLGVANAVHYLHTMEPFPVMCGNITSKNILLDQHFQPKVSDFAMVHLRSYLINQTCTVTMDHATLQSLGYLPVEYIRRGNLSSKTDVYSYGVIMMEVLTGLQSVLKGSENLFLRELLWELSERSGVAPLLQMLDEKCDSWPQTTAHRLLDLSMVCTSGRIKERPTMAEVLAIIEASIHDGKNDEDNPKSLKSIPPSSYFSSNPLSDRNVPEESDESQDFSINVIQRKRQADTPCECSQSEVTYLGAPRTQESMRLVGKSTPSPSQTDPPHCDFTLPPTSKSNGPVECSCSSETVSTKSCESCIANGFGSSYCIGS
uniref:Interleukin 1 receptor associated kinase 3 n=1 Tax=Leptobrachium leishanense TaxID=445787 RepID=A0A8C5QP57_9ANUR